MIPDPRIDEAKARPIMDVWAALGAPTDLRRTGLEHVGPCPACGGRDRFGINPVQNLFLCRQCDGRGDQISLVRHVLACDFMAALKWLCGDREVGLDPEEAARRDARRKSSREKQLRDAARYRERAIQAARGIWADAIPGRGTAAEEYLALRGIRFEVWPECLRFIPRHRYVKYERPDNARSSVPVVYHEGPAMIAAIMSPQRGMTAVHQTWIDLAAPRGKARIVHPQTGEAHASKLVRGSMAAGAIRLYSSPDLLSGAGGEMVVGEGIETTLSPMMRGAPAGASFWAGVSLGHMAGRMMREPGVKWSGVPDMTDEDAFRAPRGLTRLWFIRDADSDRKMTEAKLRAGLIRQAWRQPGLDVRIAHPPEGRDMNDVLVGV